MPCPIIMFHYISDDPAYGSLGDWCLSKEKFRQFLDFLERNFYTTITFHDVVNRTAALNSRRKVILSFDDGAKHLFDFAIPELKKRKMRAVFYIPTAHIGQYNSWDTIQNMARVDLMDTEDIKELDRLGMEVGSHSHHHIKLGTLSDEKMVRDEVVVSKQIIENITGKPVYSFSYPFASVPAHYKSILTNAGYHYGVSIYQSFQSRWALRRIGYYNSDTEKTTRRKLSARYKYARFLADPFIRQQD
jgi:peptidoglycan/xylan/chitin deacetylase (PgdA/CDA1 family)